MEILKAILCVGFCTFIAFYIAFTISYAVYNTIVFLRDNKQRD